MPSDLNTKRIVKSFHGIKEVTKDPEFQKEMVVYLKSLHNYDTLIEINTRFAFGENAFDGMMRRILWHCLTRSMGEEVTIGSNVGFKHIDTFEIGSKVFIGSQTYIQGRHDGRCIIGNHVWIGPQSYFDARDMIIEDYVGWGPGAKILGSSHTGLPIEIPIISTDLEIDTVHIEPWADIGVNAVILPGITVGKGSIVGAGSIVTKNVPPFAIVAGIPAKFLRWRDGYSPKNGEK